MANLAIAVTNYQKSTSIITYYHSLHRILDIYICKPTCGILVLAARILTKKNVLN